MTFLIVNERYEILFIGSSIDAYKWLEEHHYSFVELYRLEFRREELLFIDSFTNENL